MFGLQYIWKEGVPSGKFRFTHALKTKLIEKLCNREVMEYFGEIAVAILRLLRGAIWSDCLAVV